MSISQDGAPIRVQLPAIPTTDPASAGPAGTFSNFGGVARYQVGGGTAEQAPAQRLAPVGSGVMRSTMTTDPMTGERITTNDVLGDVQRGSTESATSAAPRFTSAGGRPLMPNEIGPTSIVHVAGQTTNLAAAMHAGLIVRNSHGEYVGADGVGASAEKTPAQQLDEANAERRAAEEQSDKDGLPTVAKFDDATEALLTDTLSKVGSIDAQHAVQAAISNNGQLTPDLIARLGTQLGLDKEQMTERSNTIVQAFEKQARETVGESSADAIWAWAREAQPADLKRAMTSHANNGDTTGYSRLATQYFENLPNTQAGRALLLATPGVTERNGKLYVNTAKAGLVEYRAALKAGLVTAKHG